MVDVETGAEPRPMRTLHEEPPATPPEPPAPQDPEKRAVKRPSAKPARVAASRVPPRPELAPEVPLPVPEPDPLSVTGADPSTATLGDDEVLSLEDTVAEPGEDPAEITPWRRGLRG